MSNLLQVAITETIVSQLCRSGTVVDFAQNICVAVLFLLLSVSILMSSMLTVSMSEKFIEPEWKSSFRKMFRS